MSFLTNILPSLDRIRAGVPGALGLRPFALTVRVRTWSGARPGVGTKADTDTAITNDAGYSYKVTEVTSKDVMLSAGKYTAGMYKVGPLTPPHAGGAVTFAKLDPAVTGAATEVLYKLTDPSGSVWCRKVGVETMHPLHWYLILESTGQTP